MGFALLALFLVLSACAEAPKTPKDLNWTQAGFLPEILQAEKFKVFVAQKITQPGSDAIVYIEGDGHGWVTRHQRSTDPTPRDFLVRNWAMEDIRPNVIYLARPCQFTGALAPPCAPAYWGERRFAPEVISAMDKAMDQIKSENDISSFHLIGYSGGGGVAALLAARRNDVASLTTIAGNLDIMLHSRLHHVSPLTGSLNPIDEAATLTVPQIHYVGGKDDNVPPLITENFVQSLPPSTIANIINIPNATHSTGWEGIIFGPIRDESASGVSDDRTRP